MKRLILTALFALTLAAPAQADYGYHAMLYLNSPFSLKQQMFAAAYADHAHEIRLDVDLNQLYSSDPNIVALCKQGLIDDINLSKFYSIPILADFPGDGLHWNPTTFANEAAAVVRQHPELHDFEVINEPDLRMNFPGTPAQYGTLLSQTDHAIHAVRSDVRVLIGGLAYDSTAYLNNIGTWNYDVGNIHVRGAGPSDSANTVAQFEAVYTRKPLWVTETGYPSDPAYQAAPYNTGEQGQAAWLWNTGPGMTTWGADRIFVTERDNLTGRYASEGVVGKSAEGVFSGLAQSTQVPSS